MIALLSGVVVEKTTTSVLVETSGGVGYDVTMTAADVLSVVVGEKLIVSKDGLNNENVEQVASKSEGKTIEHIVGKGEYLGTIARKYNTTINDLLELNNLSDTNIKQGDKLIVGKEDNAIKKSNDSYAETTKRAKAKLYQVKRGDTLTSISKQFPGVTIADIKKWNGIKDENIQPGMKLKIGG